MEGSRWPVRVRRVTLLVHSAHKVRFEMILPTSSFSPLWCIHGHCWKIKFQDATMLLLRVVMSQVPFANSTCFQCFIQQLTWYCSLLHSVCVCLCVCWTVHHPLSYGEIPNVLSLGNSEIVVNYLISWLFIKSLNELSDSQLAPHQIFTSRNKTSVTD